MVEKVDQMDPDEKMMRLVFNFDQNTTPVQPPPRLVTERVVILMPFIRSGFDTDVFHAILIRVKIKIFYQENKELTKFCRMG